MVSPTKRKKIKPLKAGLICPTDEGPPKKTQAQIKREQRETADRKTKELLKRNPTYEQLAKALLKVLLNQETLIKRDEKLKAFEAYISLVGGYIGDRGGSTFLGNVFIHRAVNGAGKEDPIRQLLKGAMDLRSKTQSTKGANKKLEKIAKIERQAEKFFTSDPRWFESKHSNKRLAELMVQEYGEEIIGKCWKLERNIGKWRKPSKNKK